MDVYLDHGDASLILGTASKSIYEYVRKTLGIPFLHTARILIPIPYKAASNDVKEAPTVGGYTSILYRAIRRGELVPIISKILTKCFTDEELCL
jgi:phenylalanine ammonia-lyase